jgi:quinol monooxygenase YgiN
MNGKATRITVFSLKLGFEDLLIPEFAPIIEASRQVAGCLVFDLYRLAEKRSTLILHEVWVTRDALDGFALSPLKAELMGFVSRFLAEPINTWEVEEVC